MLDRSIERARSSNFKARRLSIVKRDLEKRERKDSLL